MYRREVRCFVLRDVTVQGDFVWIEFENITIVTTVEAALESLNAIVAELGDTW